MYKRVPYTAMIRALIRKETLQVLRDPSALLIAFALPLLLLLLFAYAVSLDVKGLPVGVVVEGQGKHAASLVDSYRASQWLEVTLAHDRRTLQPLLQAGHLRALVIIPADFDTRLASDDEHPSLQIITDGSQPNTANFVANYASGVFDTWLQQSLHDFQMQADERSELRSGGVILQARVWFNPELDSRLVLLPGAIAIIMTMIGTLLTALVVAREWERGTMEAMLATPVGMLLILVCKLVPYFLLALMATAVCTILSVYAFGLPLRGSLGALLLLSLCFLLPALGQGLLISTVTRNQFIASQVALLSAFLPSFLLSGFLFEIASMPWPVRFLTHAVAARWYVEGLQSLFLTGDVWSLLLRDMLYLLVIGAVFILLSIRKSRAGLES